MEIRADIQKLEAEIKAWFAKHFPAGHPAQPELEAAVKSTLTTSEPVAITEAPAPVEGATGNIPGFTA